MFHGFKYCLFVIALAAAIVIISGMMNTPDDDNGVLLDHWAYVEFIVPENGIVPAPAHIEKTFLCPIPPAKLLFTTVAKPVLPYIETRAHGPPVC
jgi:hypothetical protein